MTNTKTLQESDLRQFTGTETWYRHPLARKVLYTDGVQHVAEQGGAYWLLDSLAFAQAIPAVAAESFQFWILTVKPDHAATLVCEDGNGKIVHTQEITFTDFPLPVIKFYVTDSVILLPSEY
jgi:hypothetical protein